MSIIAVIENHAIGTVALRRRVMEEIEAAGHEVHVLTGGGADFDRARELGIRMHDIGTSVQNPLAVARYLERLASRLRAIGPDLCLTYTIRPAIYGNLVCTALRIPTITNITGIGPLFESRALAYRIARTLYRGAMRHPSIVFFQNQDDREIFLAKKIVTLKRSRCIPGSGVDCEHYSPRHQSPTLPQSGPLGEKKEGPRFLFIGRLVKDKGVLEFLKAAEMLRRSHPQIRCQILGPLWTQNIRANTITRDDIDAWQASGVLEYLGEQDDVRDFIAKADCIVLPSYREGTANVLLEACSMGKPVIASRVTGCKEIIEEGLTGLFCAPRDPHSLAAAMRQMVELGEEARDKMGVAGRRKVMRQFDKQLVVDAYLRAISEVLND